LNSDSLKVKNKIGILALQGDFGSHAKALAHYGVGSKEVRNAEDLNYVSALILPGGESSTFLKLIDKELAITIKTKVKEGLPVLATCAGAILISKVVENPAQDSLQLIDTCIRRNAYGRQADSFITPRLSLKNPQDNSDLSSPTPLEKFIKSHSLCVPSDEVSMNSPNMNGIFIRAPKIISYGNNVTPLLFQNEDPVLLIQNNILLATFHPELSDHPHLVYHFFLSKVKEYEVLNAI